MKKLLILSALVLSLVAEEPETLNILSFEKTEEELAPAAAPPSEELAKQEIEFFFEDQNAPTPPKKEASENLPLPEVDGPKGITFQEDLSMQKEIFPIDETASPSIEENTTDTAAAAPTSDENILADEEIADLEAEVSNEKESGGVVIDLNQVFSGSPTIYSILILLSVGSFGLWLYSMLSLRTSQMLPKEAIIALREKLENREYGEALELCNEQNSVFFQMMATALVSRRLGVSSMMEMMQSEGRRMTTSLWQKIHLLNDVAILAPMLGLLGTVLGMFYAFYDLNRSMESVSALFDGLGISVGTTVGGLFVAILAMMFYSMTKYRLIRQLSVVENEARSLASLIDDNQGDA